MDSYLPRPLAFFLPDLFFFPLAGVAVIVALADAMARVQAAGGPRMFVQLDAIEPVLAEHNQLIRDVWRDPKSGLAEKRQLIDQLYFSMIEIGQHGKQAMKEIDAGLNVGGGVQ
jgi:hypothetical protein